MYAKLKEREKRGTLEFIIVIIQIRKLTCVPSVFAGRKSPMRGCLIEKRMEEHVRIV